jgi:hypothetical protein
MIQIIKMTSSKPAKVGSFHSQEKEKRYINEQEGKDVFEYSVFGSPNQKIGKFASQTKLGEWS